MRERERESERERDRGRERERETKAESERERKRQRRILHAHNTLLVTSPCVQSLLKVTCVWGGGRGLAPFLPSTVRCPRPSHLPRVAGRATQKAGREGGGGG